MPKIALRQARSSTRVITTVHFVTFPQVRACYHLTDIRVNSFSQGDAFRRCGELGLDHFYG